MEQSSEGYSTEEGVRGNDTGAQRWEIQNNHYQSGAPHQFQLPERGPE